jgi:hypothetical protein
VAGAKSRAKIVGARTIDGSEKRGKVDGVKKIDKERIHGHNYVRAA